MSTQRKYASNESLGRRSRLALLAIAAALALLFLPQCGDRVVGLECEAGEACGDTCCDEQQECRNQQCVPRGSLGGAPGIGGAASGGGPNASGGTQATGGFAGAMGGMAGKGTGGAPSDRCPLGTTRCGIACIDTDTDRDNCGACANQCAFDETCADGSCENVCGPPLVECSGVCVDLRVNNDYCGDCSTSCGVGQECVEADCSEGKPGHVVLFGHSFASSSEPYERMLGNSVFIPLPSRDPVRVLVFEGDAEATTIANIDAAIDTVAASARTWTREQATASNVTQRLRANDALLIYPQTAADDSTLESYGQAWASALEAFLRRGGSVIVVDGAGSNTWKVLDSAGLIDIDSRSSVPAMEGLQVVDGSDSLVAGVDVDFNVVAPTFSYEGGEPEDVVTVVAPPSSPVNSKVVVFHRDVLQ